MMVIGLVWVFVSIVGGTAMAKSTLPSSKTSGNTTQCSNSIKGCMKVSLSVFAGNVRCVAPSGIQHKKGRLCEIDKKTPLKEQKSTAEYDMKKEQKTVPMISRDFRNNGVDNLRFFLITPTMTFENKRREFYNNVNQNKKKSVKMVEFLYIDATGYQCKSLEKCIVYTENTKNGKFIITATVIIMAEGFLEKFSYEEVWKLPTK
jgi:hypothetical protein